MIVKGKQLNSTKNIINDIIYWRAKHFDQLHVFTAPCLKLDDVIKWKHFQRYWSFVRGIHRPQVSSHHNGQWRRTFIFSLMCWIKCWVNNRDAGDLICHGTHFDDHCNELTNGHYAQVQGFKIAPLINHWNVHPNVTNMMHNVGLNINPWSISIPV